ncbi:hypothetical protein PACTADRAFT_34315 [Pachysolen tannophilus NRRL Y-2460]|uniref:Catalase n=1 Tax=Pachysolen tannophilus NRRL Y-2460 TaxID=669874 RepID=A0A1E4TS44_PACTA|nr:hypothetical protein PACTADRAFT_34315 [Pachysolen tannophilus NRRL Y-2460]
MADKKIPPVMTTSQGCPVSDPFKTQRVAIDTSDYKHAQPPQGPLLLQDFQLIDALAHFDRERIPERVVHAKGAGAFGVFEATDDISDICKSSFLQKGKRTRTLTRFSTVGGEKGSADTARDPRGFATKFYTEEGNLDFVYNNTPVFFIRDPIKFPHFIHTQKKTPQKNTMDGNNAFWDYLTTNPESIHQVMVLFSDRGTPASYRKMNGYSGHTYKWYNAKGEWHYVQVHMMSDQGVESLTVEQAAKHAGEDPDFITADLFDNIEKGNNPSWTMYIQTMTLEESKKLPFSVFDLTKVWPHSQFPLRRFGKLTLNENPKNYFAEIEQAAFSPSHTVPGMEASFDPVLQSRLFSYPDTHRHRLGTNYNQIPVNCPLKSGVFNPIIRDGAMTVNGNMGSHPNYLATQCPVTFAKALIPAKEASTATIGGLGEEKHTGEVVPFHWTVTDYDFVQPRALWKVLGRQSGQQRNFIHNVAVHIANSRPDIQERVYDYFSKVSKEIGEGIRREVQGISSRAKL